MYILFIVYVKKIVLKKRNVSQSVEKILVFVLTINVVVKKDIVVQILSIVL